MYKVHTTQMPDDLGINDDHDTRYMTRSQLATIGIAPGAFTQGSIIFADAAGNLTEDNAAFFYNDATNQLLTGTGTAALPVYSFIGDVDTGFYHPAGDNIGIAINGALDFSFTANSFNVLAGSNITMADDAWIGTATGRIIFDSGGATDEINFMDCIVGINTPTPATYLHIYEDVNTTTPQFLIEQDNATGDAAMRFLLTGGQSYAIGIDNSDSDSFKISPGAALPNADYFVMGPLGTIGLGALPAAGTQAYIYRAAANGNTSSFQSNSLVAATANGNYSGYSIYFRSLGRSNVGIANAGSVRGYLGYAVVDSASHLGSIATIMGQQLFYGVDNSGATGTVGTIDGIRMNPRWQAGNGITTFRDIYIAAPVVGGVAPTNEWCIISDHDAVSRFVGEIQVDSDTNGFTVGAGQGMRMFYDGSDSFFRMLAGTGRFIFDTYNNIDQECEIMLMAGEGMDATVTWRADEADDNADRWRIRNVAADNEFKVESYATGAWVSILAYTTTPSIEMGDVAGGVITEIEGDGTLDFIGATAGNVRGSCYGNHIAWVQAAAVQNTWYNISDAGMISGQLNKITHDGNGQLTVPTDGDYLVTYCVCFNDDTAKDHVEVGIEVAASGAAVANGQCHLQNKFADETEHASGSTMLDLSANDTVECAIRTIDVGAPDFTVHSVNLTLVKIGGT